MSMPDSLWPPPDALAFIRSPEFGELLIDLVDLLAERYRHMDFSDAVAHVFAWFDGRLAREPGFLNGSRFPSPSAFRAYLRQAVWNAARLAERKRKRHERVVALPTDQPITTQEMGYEERDELLLLIESLQDPHKLVFTKCFFEEQDLSDIAAVYDWPEEQVKQIYEEAIDQIARKLRKRRRQKVKKE